MAWDDLAKEAIDASYDEFGKAATYTPPGGGPAMPCTVILDLRDPASRPDDGRPVEGVAIIQVRKSEVAAPAHDGVFAVTALAKSFSVTSRPQPNDPDGIEWMMWGT